ncbi:MAG: histone deacetylase family protein [Hyphomicrobiaceae bacterium]
MSIPTFFYPDVPEIPLPDGHRFPAGKYRQLRERVIAEGVLGTARLLPSPVATREQLLRAHDPDYVDAVFNGSVSAEIQRRIGLPWSPELVRRSCAAVGGSLAAARTAMRDGISGQLAGGTHHAHRAYGSGFCTFNDLAVAALSLLNEGSVARVAIIDLDVHQGDGNAAILAGDPRTFVVSLHGEKNFPFRKVASDIDFGLADGTANEEYLATLSLALDAIDRFKPDLILYLSGADALASDTLGRLALTQEGLSRRDRTVFRFAHERGWPISVVLGGGYARAIEETVDVYAGTLKSARAVFKF